jgi:pimeloyl-ACP methyl ester carboxylesterase
VNLNVITALPETGARRHPVLFVHGAWHGAWCWERFLPWFAERGWEAHALDLRGHGQSPSDRSLRRTRIKHYVEDLESVVDSFDDPPYLVAHSMGSLVAQKYLEDHTLPGAVLVAPLPLGGVWKATLRAAARHPLKFLQANLTWNLGPLVSKRSLAKELFFADDTPEEDVDRYWPMLQPESYPAYLDMLLLLRPRPQLVDTPIAIVSGSEDWLFRVRDHEKLGLPYGVEPIVVDGAAHSLMLDPRWERVAEAIAGALES